MKLLSFIFILSLIVGCQSNVNKEYLKITYLEADETIRVGAGGSKTIIGEIDFWEYGSPDCKFVTIGMIEDLSKISNKGENYPDSQLMLNQQIKIANAAKNEGADAVILTSSSIRREIELREEAMSMPYNSNYTISRIAFPGVNIVNYLMIKYIK